nr:oplophorus-luciferin 2-monooxygenase non-catalytic subunit-like [Procambarus clarkii]
MESSYILLLLLLSSKLERCLGMVGNASNVQRLATCLAAEDITPCVCSQEDPQVLDMDCSEVADENELAAVFQANFPSTNFRRLTIKANQNLKTLRSGDLGDASFQEIWITKGGLEEIQEGALSGSVSTVTYLVFNYNNISSFPFVDLETFTHVQSLDLRHNNIRGFPMLFSTTLETLYLSGNPLGELPPSAFSNTSALVDIHLSSANITQVTLGVFRDLPNLRNLGLGDNSLTYLAGGSFKCSPTTGLIDLGYNQLAGVSPASFTGEFMPVSAPGG